MIHERRGAPVEPATVMAALARHSDLDAELLQFYALFDGLEIVVAEPRVSTTRYDTVDTAQAIAARSGGLLGRLDALLMHPELGPALFREFCDDSLRVLAIPPLQHLLDTRDAIVLDRGTVVALAHVDELRAASRRADDRRWWVVRRQHDGTPELLRWSELLAASVAGLDRA